MLSRFENFTSRISEINRSVQKIEKDEMEKYGYRGAFARYLVIMRQNEEGLTISRLCEKSDRDKAAVSRILSEMGEKGLVRRVDGPSGAYRAKYVLTQAGVEAADFVCGRALLAVDTVGRALTSRERDIFYRALEIIAKELEILEKKGLQENDG